MLLGDLNGAPVQIWGATRPPPGAEGGRGASGSGRQMTKPHSRRGRCRVPQQDSSTQLDFDSKSGKQLLKKTVKNIV